MAVARAVTTEGVISCPSIGSARWPALAARLDSTLCRTRLGLFRQAHRSACYRSGKAPMDPLTHLPDDIDIDADRDNAPPADSTGDLMMPDNPAEPVATDAPGDAETH